MTAEENKDSENSSTMASSNNDQKQQVFQENQKMWISQSEDHFDKKQYSGKSYTKKIEILKS